MSAVCFTTITPNLVVRDVAGSTASYRDALGFAVKDTVPAMANPTFGGTDTPFVIMSGVDALHAAVAPLTPVVMPLHTTFYGMREFAVQDPDGHLNTFAERVG